MRRLPALLLLLSACDDDERPGAQGDPGQPTEVLLGGWTPLVQVSLDDHDPEWMLVDTGAPYTYVDPTVFDIEDGVTVLRNQTLGAFGLTFAERDVVILDLGGALAGLFGADILSSYQFAVDYQASEAYLFEDVALPVDLGADTLPVETVDAPVIGPGKRIVVDVEIEGVEAKALLDTGASYVTVDPAFLEDLGLGRPELCCQTVITADGEFEVPVTRLKSLKVGGVAEVTSVVASPEYPGSTLLSRLSAEVDEPLVALIGGAYLREFLITVDYPHERLWLERYRSDDHIDRREYVGPGFEILVDYGNFFVAHVYQDTDAQAQGVQPFGYELIEINAIVLSGMPVADVRERMRSFEPGTIQEFSFRLTSNGNEVSLDLEIADLLPEYR